MSAPNWAWRRLRPATVGKVRAWCQLRPPTGGLARCSNALDLARSAILADPGALLWRAAVTGPTAATGLVPGFGTRHAGWVRHVCRSRAPIDDRARSLRGRGWPSGWTGTWALRGRGHFGRRAGPGVWHDRVAVHSAGAPAGRRVGRGHGQHGNG